jgi:hypothetical protein
MKATPKDWSDVTIAQYYNLCEAIEMDWNDDTDKAIAMLSALSGIPIKVLNEEIPAKKLIKAINDIKFITEAKPKGYAKSILRIGRRRFRVDLMIKNSTASNFISLTEYTKSNDVAKINIHNIMSIFCHEINWFGFKKKRTVHSQREIAEYLKANLTMDKAFIYSGFFLKSWKALSKAMLDYSELQIKKAMKIVAKEARSL